MVLHITAAEVRRRIAEQDAGWVVREEVAGARLRDAGEPVHSLGYIPGPGAPTLAEAERAAGERLETTMRASALVEAPRLVDWRARGGRSYITPVRDQRACGSCVAFGVLAAVESMVCIATGTTPPSQNLSEAQLFFCYGPDGGAGPCPDGGWWPDPAYDALRGGVVDERTYHYTDVSQRCRLPVDWRTKVTRVTRWRLLTSPTAIKRHLAGVGPVTACFTVYEDFYFYGGGVYRRTSDEAVGGHCICLIGYDDARRCWIGKNSWGTGWGDDGYLLIGYGECGIDDMVWAPDEVVVSELYPWPVLRRDDHGGAVRTLQRLLRSRGHRVAVDGDFGARTQAAVRVLQRARQRPVDGVVGVRTWLALIQRLREGGRGEAVRALQTELRGRRAASGLVVDGVFGPATTRAVRAFQRSVRQEPDGAAGAFTWQALVGGMGQLTG